MVLALSSATVEVCVSLCFLPPLRFRRDFFFFVFVLPSALGTSSCSFGAVGIGPPSVICGAESISAYSDVRALSHCEFAVVFCVAEPFDSSIDDCTTLVDDFDFAANVPSSDISSRLNC